MLRFFGFNNESELDRYVRLDKYFTPSDSRPKDSAVKKNQNNKIVKSQFHFHNCDCKCVLKLLKIVY